MRLSTEAKTKNLLKKLYRQYYLGKFKDKNLLRRIIITATLLSHMNITNRRKYRVMLRKLLKRYSENKVPTEVKIIALVALDQYINKMKKLEESMDKNFKESKSKWVSNNETNRILGLVDEETAYELGYKFKTWVHGMVRQPKDARESHLELDGTTIPIEEDFDVDGYPASFPRDPRLPISESIYCGCGVRYSK